MDSKALISNPFAGPVRRMRRQRWGSLRWGMRDGCLWGFANGWQQPPPSNGTDGACRWICTDSRMRWKMRPTCGALILRFIDMVSPERPDSAAVGSVAEFGGWAGSGIM